MKNKTTALVATLLFSAVLSTAFFYGCGGHKEEVKQDSLDSLAVDTIKVDSLGVDTIKVDTITE